ncbi:MAG: DUF3108 domain-containing protein [Dissulfurispiraceae bacterium]
MSWDIVIIYIVLPFNNCHKTIKSNVLLIVFSVMFSVLLHLTLFAGMADMYVADLAGSFSQSVLYVTIESESQHPHATNTSIRKVSLANPAKKELEAQVDNGVKEARVLQEARVAPTAEDVPPAAEIPPSSTKQDDIEVGDKAPVRPAEGIAGVGNGAPAKPAETFRERLSYDIYWMGIYVGRAVIEAINENGEVSLASQVHSSPFVSAFYRVEDYAKSTISNGSPSHFSIKQIEGKYRSDKETFFDMNNQKIIFFDYLKELRKEYDVTEKEIWDVISGFYYLRSQPLEVGRRIDINIFDSNKFYTAEVDVLRKETIKLYNFETVNAVIIKPMLKSEGLFQNKGEILIWLTDDEHKIPVKIETQVPIGKVVAELTSLETME